MIERDDYRDLVARLDGWAVSASAPSDEGPIDVTLPDGRAVQVVLSADDLDDLYVVHGSLPPVVDLVLRELRRLPSHARFLVQTRDHLLSPSAEQRRRRRASGGR